MEKILKLITVFLILLLIIKIVYDYFILKTKPKNQENFTNKDIEDSEYNEDTDNNSDDDNETFDDNDDDDNNDNNQNDDEDNNNEKVNLIPTTSYNKKIMGMDNKNKDNRKKDNVIIDDLFKNPNLTNSIITLDEPQYKKYKSEMMAKGKDNCNNNIPQDELDLYNKATKKPDINKRKDNVNENIKGINPLIDDEKGTFGEEEIILNPNMMNMLKTYLKRPNGSEKLSSLLEDNEDNDGDNIFSARIINKNIVKKCSEQNQNTSDSFNLKKCGSKVGPLLNDDYTFIPKEDLTKCPHRPIASTYEKQQQYTNLIDDRNEQDLTSMTYGISKCFDVPQVKAPSCIPQKKLDVVPAIYKPYEGTPLKEARDTAVGSILPKFQYNEIYDY
jgi:hypothetical protein